MIITNITATCLVTYMGWYNFKIEVSYQLHCLSVLHRNDHNHIIWVFLKN